MLRTGCQQHQPGEMSETEAVPDTPVEETPNAEEPLNDVSILSNKERGGRGAQHA